MKNKTIKILTIIMVLAIMMPMIVFAESSSRVGEYVPFNSGGINDSGGGTSNTGTVSEKERQAAQTNSTASRQIQTKVGQLIQSNTVDTGFVLWQDGGYTFITQQNIARDELPKLTEIARMYNSIGYGYSIPIYTPRNPDLNDEDRSVFRDIVNSEMGGGSVAHLETSQITNPLWDIDYINWTNWGNQGFGSFDEFIDGLMNQGGRRIRTDLDNGFIDFPNMETRYRMLNQYLNATSNTDTIKMQYVLEYRIEDTAHNTIYRMTGQNGMNSYTWNFANDTTGESYSQYNLAPAIYHQFMREGQYSIDISKEVLKTYCEAFSFSINEYWIIEETGQVVWKRETTGKNIDSAIPAMELGMRNLVMYNTPDPAELPNMETIHVATIYHNVTEEMLNLSIPAEGSFRQFYTERIE